MSPKESKETRGIKQTETSRPEPCKASSYKNLVMVESKSKMEHLIRARWQEAYIGLVARARRMASVNMKHKVGSPLAEGSKKDTPMRRKETLRIDREECSIGEI